jgi:cytochrome c-type biogenesis protein CcmH/NrfG
MPSEGGRAGAAWSSREVLLLALVCLTLGLVVGYMFRGPSASAPVASAPTPAGGAAQPTGAPSSAPPAPTAESLQPLAAPLLAALRADPKNFDTLVQLGNLYYDNKVYPPAIEYYTRALELRPKEVNVHTDLGTAYWYSNFPDKAVKEYEKSLAIDLTHANTLFNLGIVRAQGLNDNAGAIAAWEKLLQTNPQYPQKQRVLELIAQARSQGGSAPK